MDLTIPGILVTISYTLALFLCKVVRDAAIRRKLVDVPNARSLHETPVPRLGGVAITLTVWSLLGLASLWSPLLWHRDVILWFFGSVLIAGIGLLDDLKSLSAAVRFLCQIGVATAVLVAVPLATIVPLGAGWEVSFPRAMMLVLGVLFVVGTTNIYNFMDGMDGIAGVQSIGAGLALSGVTAIMGHFDLCLVALVVAGASAGFLLHNVPPATLFLGDAGSTFLGFTFSTIGLVAMSRPSPVPFLVVPVALSPFLLDGTFTILRRLSRGEPIWKAHRSHLYQRAVASGLGHREVLVVYAAWTAAASAAALLIARADARQAAVVLVAMGAALVGVWRWVVVRERSAAPK